MHTAIDPHTHADLKNTTHFTYGTKFRLQKKCVTQSLFELFHCNCEMGKNKLRWYPQQPKGWIFTSLSEACCEAASIHLSLVSVS